MKDSQPLREVGVGVPKYIKADNERFSTWCVQFVEVE